MTWTRQGECNHCGFCCLFLTAEPHMLTFNKETMKDKEGKYDAAHAQVRGMAEQDGGEMVVPAWFYSPCTAFDTTELRCGIHEEKPQLCKDFPWLPSQVVGTPCSYYFEKTTTGPDLVIKTLRQGGQSSPFPGRSIQEGTKVFLDEADYFNIPYPVITPRSLLTAFRSKVNEQEQALKAYATQGMATEKRSSDKDQGHEYRAPAEFDPFAAEDDTRI